MASCVLFYGIQVNKVPLAELMIYLDHLYHLDHIYVVMVCDAGSVYNRSNSGNVPAVLLKGYADHTAPIRQHHLQATQIYLTWNLSALKDTNHIENQNQVYQ